MVAEGKQDLIRGRIEFLLLTYVIVFGISYATYPLALAPQLDAQENLRWANMLYSGTLPEEPFYRAMLYPLVIGAIQSVSDSVLLLMGIGLTLHVVIAFQVRALAGYFWNSKTAQTCSFLLYLLNPVSLFYAVQIMDMTMGMALFLAAIQLQTRVNSPSRMAFLLSGIVAGLACLTRPHYLPAAIILAVVPLFTGKSHVAGKAIAPLFILCGMGGMLLLQGIMNFSHSGEFRILPWQGSYNLYAANRQGANGLYFTQQIDVAGTEFVNPAQAEAEQLYRMQTGKEPPFSVSEQTAYWKKRAIGLLGEDPVRLMKLLLFKAYAVANSHEAYNNVTYAYHKDRLKLLKYNPLNYGLLLILAIVGSSLLLQPNRGKLFALWLLILGYSVSLILYYVSAKFRLPLVPLLTILAAGGLSHWKMLVDSRHNQVKVSAIAVATAAIAFSSFGGIRSDQTMIQDRLLMANAHAELGNDSQAVSLAVEVLREQPMRREALRIYTVSYFNLQLLGDPAAANFGSWQDQAKWIVQQPPTDPVQDAVLGVFYWKWGERDRATSIWNRMNRETTEGTRLARACLNAVAGMDTSDPLTLALRELLMETE